MMYLIKPANLNLNPGYLACALHRFVVKINKKSSKKILKSA